MTGKLNNGRNIAVIKTTKLQKRQMQCQRMECLMDTQSKTEPNTLRRQITIKKTRVHLQRLMISFLWAENGKM